MIKYLIKKKIQKETQENSKKALIYAGAVMTGVGLYFSYKSIQNCRKNKYIDEFDYLDFDEYNKQKEEEYELEQKIKEFNSKRINSENCTDVSKEEMIKLANSIKESKIDIDNKDKYNEQPYEEYEYIEEDLIKKD